LPFTTRPIERSKSASRALAFKVEVGVVDCIVICKWRGLLLQKVS
jgi:hypothetical protein